MQGEIEETWLEIIKKIAVESRSNVSFVLY